MSDVTVVPRTLHSPQKTDSKENENATYNTYHSPVDSFVYARRRVKHDQCNSALHGRAQARFQALSSPCPREMKEPGNLVGPHSRLVRLRFPACFLRVRHREPTPDNGKRNATKKIGRNGKKLVEFGCTVQSHAAKARNRRGGWGRVEVPPPPPLPPRVTSPDNFIQQFS